MNLRKTIAGLVIAALASTAVYAVLLFYGDGPAVVAALRSFPVSTFALMLLLSIGCYLARAARWGMLVRRQGHRIRYRDALYLHVSGQTMAVSPGRVGELLKPLLTREVVGLPMSSGIALLFAERVADLLAAALLSLGALSLLGGGAWSLLLMLAALAGGTWVASSEWFHQLALRVVERQEWARKHQASAVAISETIRSALGLRMLALSTIASAVAWAFEGVGLWVCVEALGYPDVGVVAAVSVYAISMIVGALTFLPGGIGTSEASMAGILVVAGLGATAASAATLLTRVATLWWGVLLGWLMIVTRPSVFRGLFSADAEAADSVDAPDDRG